MKYDKTVSSWLVLCCSMVVIMILIGGITRLTSAGLSITEWQPITGIIPPLSSTDWGIEFIKYQKSPEFIHNNFDISLSDFKTIYLIEYFHRLAARLTGLIFLIPLIYFYVRNKLDRKSLPIYLVTLGLFFLQGFMGWYMVKSGLVSNPYVSPARLALHLLMAVFIYSFLFWELMKQRFDILLVPSDMKLDCTKYLSLFCIGIIFVQIFLGGMVAGLKAGLVYNSFPLMGDSFVPSELDFFNLSLYDFNNPILIQFLHRINAYLLTASLIALVVKLFTLGNFKLRKTGFMISAAISLQLISGIITILYAVPITIAIIHQVAVIFLISSILWVYFLLKV